MTVKHLIKILNKYPKNACVSGADYSGAILDIKKENIVGDQNCKGKEWVAIFFNNAEKIK